jgi:hypothetical protein
LEVSGQLHAPAALPPGKEPPVPIGQEVGWTSEPVKWKFLTPPGLEQDSSVVQPVASRYTDCAIPAPGKTRVQELKWYLSDQKKNIYIYELRHWA